MSERYSFELVQGGKPVAFGSGDDVDQVRADALHYLAVYSRDGSASLRLRGFTIDGLTPAKPVGLGTIEVMRAACACSEAFDTPLTALLGRRRAAALPRQVLFYVAVVTLELSQERVAKILGRRRPTISHALKVIEERREEPTFDALVGRIEAAVSAAASTVDQVIVWTP